MMLLSDVVIAIAEDVEVDAMNNEVGVLLATMTSSTVVSALSAAITDVAKLEVASDPLVIQWTLAALQEQIRSCQTRKS